MDLTSLKQLSIKRASDLHRPFDHSNELETWTSENLKGRLVEISEDRACGATTFVTDLILKVQDKGQIAVWVVGSSEIFFPTDLAEAGVDLESLFVVWAKNPINCLFTIELLLKAGAFELIICDLGKSAQVQDSALGRLVKLAEQKESCVLFLTYKASDEPSLGSMISLRGAVTKANSGTFDFEVLVVKDKKSNPGLRTKVAYHGPNGLR